MAGYLITLSNYLEVLHLLTIVLKKRALSFIDTGWNVYRWDGKMSGICLKNPVLVEESEWVIDETWLAKS